MEHGNERFDDGNWSREEDYEFYQTDTRHWKDEYFCLEKSPIRMQMFAIITQRSSREVQDVQSCVECFVASAHEEQYVTVGVVEAHYRVLRKVQEFMAAFSLQKGPAQFMITWQ